MTMLTLFIFFLASFVLAALSTFYYKLWWKPIRTQHVLRSQGLKGPSYKFTHGNTKEILEMRTEANSTPYALWQHDVFPRILPHLNAWKKLYGNNFLIWMGDQPQVVVTEPDLVKEILTNKDGVFRKIQTTGFAKKFIGDGLFTAEGEKWSRLRKLANYAFHGENLKEMVPSVVESVGSMLEKWRYAEDAEIDISKEFKLLTSDVISRTAFGSSYMEGKNIFEMINQFGALIIRNSFRVSIPVVKNIWRSKDEIESEEIEQSLRDSIISMIKKREDDVRTGQAENLGCDYLGSLLRSGIPLDSIVDECKIFYIAGHETTSNLLSWMIVLLSIYTEWQEKAREEVLQLLGQEKPTAEGIGRLKILSMIINETLRLYSPVVQITRRCYTKTRLGEYELPANVDVLIAPLSLHTNPDLWGQDAHQFVPERFAGGLAKATNGKSSAFLPFGAGPRVCVGLNFAANEAKIALSMILRRYKLILSPNYVHSPFHFLTISPKHGIPVILQPL